MACFTTAKKRTREQRDGMLGFLMSSPLMLFVLLISILPFLASFVLCFTDYTLLKQDVHWVGFKNFIQIVSNRTFKQTIETTLILTIGSIVGTLVLGLFYTMVLSFDIPGKSVIKAIVLLPWVIPDIIVGYVWKWMFTTDFGVAYSWLVDMGIMEAGTGLFTNVFYARLLVILCFSWRSAPFTSIMLYAQLKSLPTTQAEAAKIDGANALQGFRYITLPWLMPILKRTTLLQYVWAFNSFTIIYSLTNGGPGTQTATMPFMMQTTAFTSFMFGKGSAYAVLILLVLGVSFLAFLFLKKIYERLCVWGRKW